MKKIVLVAIITLSFAVSAMAMGRDNHKGRNPGQNNPEQKEPGHKGGGGTPEPLSILLILGGLGAAWGVKKIIKK